MWCACGWLATVGLIFEVLQLYFQLTLRLMAPLAGQSTVGHRVFEILGCVWCAWGRSLASSLWRE